MWREKRPSRQKNSMYETWRHRKHCVLMESEWCVSLGFQQVPVGDAATKK